MSRLLPRWRPSEDAAEAKRAVERAERESAAPSEHHGGATAGGDPEALRGIPAIGRGVGGKVTSSQPLRVCAKCGKPPRGKRRCRCPR